MTEATAFLHRVAAEAGGYVRADWPVCAVVVAFYAALSIATDLLLVGPAAALVNAVLSFVLTYLQLLVTFRMAYAKGAAPAGYTPAALTEKRLPSMIAVSFLAGIPILLGLVLLVVPGLVLAMLWSLTMPALAIERLGASEAMSRSWQLVRPAMGRIALLGAIVLTFLAALAAADFSVHDLLPSAAPATIVVGEILASLVLILNAAIWTAAYLDLRASEEAPT